MKFFTILAFCALIIQNVSAAKILGVFAFPGKSHSIMLLTIMKELANRGHEVTVITNYPTNEIIANYTQIVIEPSFDYWKNTPVESLFDLTEMTFPFMMNFLFNVIGQSTTEHALKNERVQELIHRTGDSFDLIVAEQFYQEAFLMLAHKYKAPVVTVGTFGFAQHMSPLFGVLSPWSHVPHEFLPYTDRMTFFERVETTLLNLYEYYLRQYQYLPMQDELARKYFSHLPGVLPSVKKLEKNISVLLLNSHVSLSTPRPVVTGIVQVGGLHIKKTPSPLPDDIKEFLDGAQHGVIYFSLGTNLKSSELPLEKLNIFKKVFSELKQRVLWKFETDAKFSKNVMIKNWLPQSDILAHPQVKVFITHGGLLGTQEGVYHAVPMLGIPIFADQHLNMKKANVAGYAINFSFQNITEISLKWALNELLQNPMYKEKVNQISKQFRDRPMNPLDESIYWIEFVARHKGAPHIRSSALDMSWFSYMLLDVILFFVLCIVGGLTAVYIIVKLLRRNNLSQNSRKNNKKNK